MENTPKTKSPTPGWAVALMVVGVLVLLGMAGLAAVILGIIPAREENNREPQLDPDASYVFYFNGGNGVIVDMDKVGISEPATFYVSAASGLSVRSGPGTEYERLGILSLGDEVQVESWENSWAYIGAGWVSGDYLSDQPVEIPQPEQTTPVQPDPIQPDPVQPAPEGVTDPSQFLHPTPPADSSLVGSWVFPFNLYTVNLGDITSSHCRAIVLTLKADGTFEQNGCTMMLTDGQWYYPGGDEPGPHYVGDYTYNGQTLVLSYRAREHDNYVEVSPAEPPMWVSSEWRAESHQASLSIGVLEHDGSMLSRTVSGTASLPIYMDPDPTVRHATKLYREAGYESLYLIDYLGKVLPMFFSGSN